MDTLLRRHLVSLIITTLLTLGVLGGVLFLFSTMDTKLARVADIKERLASYQKNKKEFTEEATELKVLEARLRALESNIVTKATVPNLLSSLETLAGTSGASFEITSVDTPLQGEVTTLVVDCTVRGSYKQVQTFLDVLQHQSYQMQFNKLFLFSEESETQLPDTSGTLTVGKKIKTASIPKETQWRGVMTFTILSF